MAWTMLWAVEYIEPAEKNGVPNQYEWTPTGEQHGIPFQTDYQAPYQGMACLMSDSWVRAHYRLKFSTTGWSDTEKAIITCRYDPLFESYTIKQEFRYDPPDDWVIEITLPGDLKNWTHFHIAPVSENNNFRIASFDEECPYDETKTGEGDQGTFYWFFRLSAPIALVPPAPILSSLNPIRRLDSLVR